MLAGKTLATSEIRQNTGVLVLALKGPDGVLSFNPASDAIIRPGDRLIAVGSRAHLKHLESLARG